MLPLSDNIEDSLPWYKQFWPWVLIGLPLSSVIAGLSTLYIAVVNEDPLVIEKWSKDGKSVYADNSRFQAAEELGLSGELKIDYVTGEIFLQLLNSGKENEPVYVYPDTLLLGIIHPTMVNRDQNISLSKVAGNNYTSNNDLSNNYRGELDHQIEANRSVFLSDSNESWQIKINIDFPSPGSVKFTTDSSITVNK